MVSKEKRKETEKKKDCKKVLLCYTENGIKTGGINDDLYG